MDGTDHRFVLWCVRDRIAGGAEHSKATVSGTAPEPHTATPCKWVLRSLPGIQTSEKVKNAFTWLAHGAALE